MRRNDTVQRRIIGYSGRGVSVHDCWRDLWEPAELSSSAPGGGTFWSARAGRLPAVVGVVGWTNMPFEIGVGPTVRVLQIHTD